MAVLNAAVVLVGVLCLLNLIFTFGVIRRLREHTEHLSKLRHQPRLAELILPAGSRVADFTATTTEGEEISADHLTQRTLVGFFSPQCGPCKERMPQFIEYARTVVGAREQVLAVILEEEGSAENAAALLPVARVVIEKDGGPVATAFEVDGFPALCLVEDRVIEISGSELKVFPTAVAV